MGALLGTIVVDCRDPIALADFWMDVLDWHVVDTDDDGAVEIGPKDQKHLSLLFQPVPEPKAVKNRLHLDLRPIGCDQRQELERLLGCGARRTDVGQGDETWIVLADPEDNEFCLLRGRGDETA
jgi:hypothetical protein